jgi:hypothetical protein
LIHQAVYPAGQRLPKWPDKQYGGYRPWAPVETRRHGHVIQIEPNRFSHQDGWFSPLKDKQDSGSLLELAGGNLKFGDYIYWVGHKVQRANFSLCRWCHKNCFDYRERKDHFDKVRTETFSHAKLLDFSAKLLRARDLCVSCGCHTRQQKWGVPLCQTLRCMEYFMFDVHILDGKLVQECQNAVLRDLGLAVDKRVVCV